MTKDKDERIVYSDDYDAFYNDETNEWVEDKCDDPTCEFCVNRPIKPMKSKPGVEE